MRILQPGILFLVLSQLIGCGNQLVGWPNDQIAPTVTSAVPARNATNVAVNMAMMASFSEAMDPGTINTNTFVLMAGTNPIVGTVSYVGVTAVFNPTADLAANTVYTATILAAASDLAGNPMRADYSWSFTTGPMRETVRPTVTFTFPSDDATGVTLDGSIMVVFSEAMNPATITTANFVIQQLDVLIDGTVTYTGVTATFNPTSPLAPNTTFSASITTGAQDLAGNSLARDYVWNFRTGSSADTTRPTVVMVVPRDVATGVYLDSNVSATFSEMIDPLTLTTASFMLRNGATVVVGTVTQIGATAIFDATSDLDPMTLYTATITTTAADLAGNPLAANYVWSFTTGTTRDPGAPTIILTSPLDLANNVPIDSRVNATFSEAMNPSTLTGVTFQLAGPGTAPVSGTVVYNVFNVIGTFVPDIDLLPSTLYTATVTTGATDLAGNGLALDYVWSFSTGSMRSGLVPVELGSLGTFVAVAGAGLTNSNSSGTTTLNGDVGLTPTGTCIGDGSPCTITNPVINGTLYANDPAGVAAQAKVDLTAAYVDAMARPIGTIVNDISGMVLAPGVYTSASTMSIAVGGAVTLDGRGDANAVWIFQIGSSLTVNNNAQILLVNGASAKNVFFAVFASSTLGSNVSFQGSILAGASNSVGTDSTVVGRLLCTTGAITLLSNTITLPPL